MIMMCRLMALFLALLVTGCRPIQRLEVKVVTNRKADLRLGILPSDEPGRLERKVSGLREYLTARTDREVELVVSSTYDSLGKMVEHGKVEVAWFSGISFLRTRDRHPMVPLVQVVRYGETTYRGIIVTRADSGIRSIADLAGKRFAYIDRDSGSGFYAPNEILKSHGFDPLSDFGSIAFTYGHNQSIQGLWEGRFDAVAVYEGTLDNERLEYPPDGFHVVARSQPILSDVIVASTGLDDGLTGTIRRALLEASEVPAGRAMLEQMQPYDPVDGFVPFGHSAGDGP